MFILLRCLCLVLGFPKAEEADLHLQVSGLWLKSAFSQVDMVSKDASLAPASFLADAELEW
jgi:hypothetical protein